MWILTNGNELVNTNQVISITAKDISEMEYSAAGAAKVNKKALVAGLSDGETCILVSFAVDVSSDSIGVYLDAIKQGLITKIALCDLTSL